MRISLAATLLFGLLLSSITAMDLPKAPAGYAWQEIPEIKAAFLKPEGWFFRKIPAGKDTPLAIFITREDIAIADHFETGLTINVFRNLKRETALKNAGAFIHSRMENRKGEMWTRTLGPMVQVGVLAEIPGDGHPIMVHSLSMVNTKTNTLYLIFFEGPRDEWEKTWEIGKTMLNLLAVDDEI